MASVTLFPSADHASGRLSPVTDAAAYNTIRLLLDVTANVIPAGQSRNNPPILEVHVETSPVSADGPTWRRVHSFTAVRAVGQQTRTISGFDQYLRVAYEARCFVERIDGVQQRPAFTWALTGEAT
jgi:hypothetical protein